MNDYTTCRELKPYLEPTKAMRLGAPGKFGSLDLVFELDKDKKSIMRHWDRRAPLIVLFGGSSQEITHHHDAVHGYDHTHDHEHSHRHEYGEVHS